MTRTLVKLDPEDKKWLDREAKTRHVSMAHLVRQAVHAFRAREENQARPALNTLLEQTRGIWTAGDGLAYQQRLRSEWDGDS